ncbi:hypothetical protein [Myceligenerans crystallogenes]|uniref:Sulfotransferase family protein n=1 Tax=Myceligenerans crystallogenes TaxID=316335 RepID=A0ABP4ZNA0_9MICO
MTVQAYETFAYLDVEKTGSSFITGFLGEHVAERPTRERMHGMLEWSPPKDRVHVISVRDPVGAYASLYAFGCMGKGAMAGSIRRSGNGGLYTGRPEGLSGWLEFVLDPRNARHLDPRGYRWSGAHRCAGIMSFRIARLAVPNPLLRFRRARTPEEFLAVYDRYGVIDETIRMETLREDLEAFVRRYEGRIRWRRPADEVIAALWREHPRNMSTGLDRDELRRIAGRHRADILDREPLLTRRFGY